VIAFSLAGHHIRNFRCVRRADDGDRLALAIEHRAAASSNGLSLHLLARGDSLALTVADPAPAGPRDVAPGSIVDRVEAASAETSAPLTLKALRAAVKMRSATVSDALATLVAQGRAQRTDRGYLPVAR
jgi:hypothetical protein